MTKFELKYTGADADENILDLYDASAALMGFQRSLALTSHLVINGEIITQAPSLKNARILSQPPQEGSWKITAIVMGTMTGVYNLGTAEKDTVLGHLVHSAYDYVVSESLGFHVDYDKSLGQQYEELKSRGQIDFPTLKESQLESLAEKCEVSFKEMHRPIISSGSAEKGMITHISNEQRTPIRTPFNPQTYEYVSSTTKSALAEEITVKISSYNMNTYKGRAYVLDNERPIPFELLDSARDTTTISKITSSLSSNALLKFSHNADLKFLAYKNSSSTGRVKSLSVLRVF